MSKERELLYRWYKGARDQVDFGELYDKTEELLAQPEQEPVAWCQLIDGKVQDLLTSFEMKDWLYDDTWIPLYLAQPKREPSASAREMYQRGYADGVRFAEKAHGITGDKK